MSRTPQELKKEHRQQEQPEGNLFDLRGEFLSRDSEYSRYAANESTTFLYPQCFAYTFVRRTPSPEFLSRSKFLQSAAEEVWADVHFSL